MALVLADRVKETTSSTGTTAIILAGAATGYQTFSSAVGNANTTYYTIADQTGANWEVGIGTYTTSGNTLSRDTVLASSNAGTLVAFTAGVKDVFISYPAERALYAGGPLGTPSSGTLTNATGYTYANLTGTVPTWNQNTTGTASNVTGLVAVANGGTGTATPALVAGSNVTITGTWPNQTIAASGGGGTGTVTTVSVVSANGFTGTVANATTTPAITLTTSITGVLKGNGTAISAATSGTDYSAGTSALTTGILKSTTSTGALTIAVAGDFPTLNQNTTGTAANLSGTPTLPSGTTLVAPVLGTPASGNLSNCTFPTLNQNTTGTAAGLSATLAIASGGTNSTATATAGGVGYGTGTAHAFTAAGTTGQVLTSNGASAPTWATASGGGGTATGASYTNPTAAGTSAAAFGSGASAAANYSTSLGANSSGTGGSVTATGAGAMALGGSYASGTDSFAAAIANNTSSYGATGANGVAIGLQSRSTTGISLGALAVSSGGYANSLGVSTTASGSNSTAIGSNNTASGQYAFAAGYKALSTEIGKYSYASGYFSAQGDAQHGQMVLRVATTNATPIALTSDGSAASTTNQVILSTYGSISFSAIINAKSDSMGENAGFKLEGVLNRNFGVGSVRVVGTISKTVLGKDTGAALWDVNATADTTNGGLAITVTGEASTDIRWVASVTFVESNF